MNFPIEVKVKTNCGRNNLVVKEGKYFLELNAKPKNNEANVELIKFFSKEFKVKFEKYPQCFIVPGKMHFVEEEMLNRFK